MGGGARALRRYFGLLAQRFCYIKREYQAVFEDCFRRQYSLIHRLETNKLRNVAKFFGHLLSTDAVSWCAWFRVLGFGHLLATDAVSWCAWRLRLGPPPFCKGFRDDLGRIRREVLLILGRDALQPVTGVCCAGPGAAVLFCKL